MIILTRQLLSRLRKALRILCKFCSIINLCQNKNIKMSIFGISTLQCPDKCYERGEEECDQSIDYNITWKILARAPGYNPVTKMCRLCLKESFLILFHPETASLNKKNEIYQGCKHKHFKFLADCKVTWSSRSNPKSLSLFCYYQCSMTNHFYISVMADESMTKQYCPIIQYTVMWLLLYPLCIWIFIR